MKFLKNLFKRSFLIRPSRVEIKALHHLLLLINGKEYKVKNVSISGIAFFLDNYKVSSGDKISGNIKIYDRTCKITLEVMHINAQLAGCKVINSDDYYKEYILNYFKSELAGLETVFVDPERLNADPDGTPYWYHSGNLFELYFTVKEGHVNKFQLNTLGHIFQMEPNKPVTVGYVWEEEKEEMAYKASSLLLNADKMPQDLCEFSLRFLDSIKNIPLEYKKEIHQKIEERIKKDWH
jgi:hypothetical protein